MSAVTARERILFARLVERTVTPGAELPAVADTDAVAAFERWMGLAPRRNRLGVRALLRADALFQPAREVLVRFAVHCYYGDPGVMRRVGYDAAAVVARGATVRATRPGGAG